MPDTEFSLVINQRHEVKAARGAFTAAILAVLFVAGAKAGYAQYVPIPNYTGIGAGAEFRGDLNNHLSGVTAVAPRLVTLTFAQLPAEQDGQLYWCKDCQQAALCAGGGAGALAIGAQGQWSCSTGGGGATEPINSLPAQTANYSANSHKITSLAADSANGDALSNGQSTINSLAAPTASVSMGSHNFTSLAAASGTGNALEYGQVLGSLTHNQPEIQIVSQSTPQTGSGTSVSLSPPAAIANGNSLLIIIENNRGTLPSGYGFPSGFAVITSTTASGGGDNPGQAIACKTAASESGNYAVSWTGSNDYVGRVIQIAGTSCADIDAYANATPVTSGLTITTPALATAHENDFVVEVQTFGNSTSPAFSQGTALWTSAFQGDAGVYFTQPFGAVPQITFTSTGASQGAVATAIAFYPSATVTAPPVVAGSSGGVVNDLAGSFNQVINVEAPFCYVAGGNGLTLAMGATGDGNHDDTAAIQNAILCACGMPTLASPQMPVHNGHPRVLLPYTGATSCYKTTQPERAFCSALDFGSDPGGSNVGGAHTSLCPNFAGPALIAEGPGYYNPSYSTSLLTGSGNSFVSSGSSMPIILSDWLNSHEVNLNANSQLGIEMTVNLSALGSDGSLFSWNTGNPGCNDQLNNTCGSHIQIQETSAGKTFCAIRTTTSGEVSGTSTDTGFTLNANHTMSWDWNGSDLYCFRDGVLVVGPLAAAGSLYTDAGSGNGLFDQAAFPDVYGGFPGTWPDQEFNETTGMPVGKFDAINISSVALHTAAYTPSTSKPAVNGNTQLIVNFPSTCTSAGQSGCSTDGTILGQTGVGGVPSGNVFLPLRSEQDPGAGEVPFIHLHDLELCDGKNFAAPDGLFAIWAFGMELDHVTCSNANNTGFNLYSNEWNSWVHDGYVGGSGHHLGWEFGNAYNESHDQNLNDNGGIVATASVGSSGGQYDEYFQHDGAGISVYDWIYNLTRFTAMYFSTDDGGSEPNHIANFNLSGNSGGEIIDGQFQLEGSSAIPIEEWSGSPVTLIGTQFSLGSSGTYPSELVNHVPLRSGSGANLPSGPDTFIGVQIPANSGNPIALSNPSGWAVDIGDQNGGDAKAIYHGTVGSGVPAVPTGAANLDGHTFRVSDANSTCTAGSAYTTGGSGRCEVSYKNGTGYIYTGAQW